MKRLYARELVWIVGSGEAGRVKNIGNCVMRLKYSKNEYLKKE
jgi:hypothetical protein